MEVWQGRQLSLHLGRREFYQARSAPLNEALGGASWAGGQVEGGDPL